MALLPTEATVLAMPRKPREWVAGGTYHVFTRGSNRHALFLYDGDRYDFLDLLAVVVERYELECLAFVLMSNHYHLLCRAPETSVISKALRDLNGTHSCRFNRRHGREAHAFRNRFGAVLQETTEQLVWTTRYILRNPVEAGLCGHPSEWPWSSFNATAGLAPPPPFLSTSGLVENFGPTRETAVANFVELVEAVSESDTGVSAAA
jgi:putative transposase